MADEQIRLEVIEESNEAEEQGDTESENNLEKVEKQEDVKQEDVKQEGSGDSAVERKEVDNPTKADAEAELNKNLRPPEPQQNERMIKLVDVPINDQNTALNVLIGFAQIAQQKGVYNFEQSHKIWECIQKFRY